MRSISSRRAAEGSEQHHDEVTLIGGGGQGVDLAHLEALVLLAGLAGEIDAAVAEAVKDLRAHGYSWSEIGSRLGITRQAAQQRWGSGKYRAGGTIKLCLTS